MSCGVELHDEFLVPLCEILPNKVLYSTRLEAVLNSWVVLFIVLNFWVSKLVGEESGVGTQNGEERRNLFP